MAKKRNKKYRGGISKATAVAFFEKRLFLNSTELISEDRINALIDPLTINLTALQFGSLDIDGYQAIHGSMFFAYHMALNIMSNGDEITKQAIVGYGSTFETAAAALESVGERFKKQGKMIANGDELNALRAIVPCLQALLSVATVGIATQANIAAKRDIAELLKI